MTLYMVVEHFRDDDAIPVYRRFRDHGRLAPDGPDVRRELGRRRRCGPASR